GGAVARLAGGGGGAREGGEQRGLIGGALFEVRHDPALVRGVGVEAAAELIVDAALDEAVERLQRGGRIDREQQIEERRARALGRRLEAAVVAIARGRDGGERLVDGGHGRRRQWRQRRRRRHAQQ